jgi:hypothetical protein
MGPSDSPHAHARQLLIPAGVSQLPAGMRGLSVPGFIVRYAPFPLTPSSRTTARTRCFIVRTGFSRSDGLAAQDWCNEAHSASLSLRLAPSQTEMLRGNRCQRPRLSRYMSNERLHGGLLSFHEIKPVSLTHRMGTDRREQTDVWQIARPCFVIPKSLLQPHASYPCPSVSSVVPSPRHAPR